MFISERQLSDRATITNYTEGDPAGPFNNPTVTPVPEAPVPGLLLQETSTEQTSERDTVVTRALGLFDNRAVISATSRVVWASRPGVTWQVVGDPNQRQSSSRPAQIEAVLQKITG